MNRDAPRAVKPIDAIIRQLDLDEEDPGVTAAVADGEIEIDEEFDSAMADGVSAGRKALGSRRPAR